MITHHAGLRENRRYDHVSITTQPQADNTAPNETSQDRLARAQQALADAHKNVRERAIKGHRDGFFTLDELNEILAELTLDPFTPTYVTRMPTSIDLELYTDAPSAGANPLTQERKAEIEDALRAAVQRVLDEHTINTTSEGVHAYIGNGYRVMVD